jgi:parvulin-like peptidyl-prolyl isomerase
VDSIRARIAPYLVLAVLLAAVGRAQEPASPATSSTNSPSTPTKKASPGTGRVILKVGDAQVTQAEFESRISDIEPQDDAEKEGLPDKDRRKLGDDYSSVLMLSQQAVASHLDSSPEVSRQLAVARMQVLSDAEFASLMRQADPTTEEIDKYYSAHLSDYDQVQIRRLFIWKRRDNSKDAPVLSAEAARARADRIRQEYTAGASEKKLAEDLRKSGDGMLDVAPLTFPRGELSPHMEKVAFALKEGQWSEVEDTPAALLLIQLVKRDRRQLGEVSSLIEKQLQGQKMQALLDDLKKKAGIWMDEQYFGTAVAPVPGAQRRVSNPPSELRKSAKKGESKNDEQ